MEQLHPLHRAFVRRPYLTGLAITVVSFLLTGGGRALATALVGAGEHVEATAAGMQQAALAVVALVVIRQVGWNRRAGITTRPQRPASWWPLVILPAGIIPLAGLLDVDWSKTSTIAASSFDYVTTGLAEELVFRGLVLTGLLVGLAGKPHGTLKAVVASSLLFGLPHIAPIGVVFAAVFGLSFAVLAIATRTIWIGVVLHVAFDLLTDLPDATAGVGTGWYLPAALSFVLVGGVMSTVGVRRGWVAAATSKV